MTAFKMFALLYMTALFLELADNWTYSLLTLVALSFVILTLSIHLTRISFLILLGGYTSYFLLFRFPDVANHANVEIYCNLVMMFGIVYSLAQSRDGFTDDDYFVMIRPLLQLTVILMYFLAGFHKLNADFVNPDVSCVTHFLGKLSRVARSHLVLISTGLLFAAGISLVVYRLFSPRPARRYLAFVVGVGAISLSAAAASIVLPSATLSLGRTPIILAAVGVILWEFVGGPLLAIPRFQAPLLAFSWIMHSTFALVELVDFGALALALLFTFVPRLQLVALDSQLHVPVLGLSIHRAHVYFISNALVGTLLVLGRPLAAGLLFNVAALVFVWPVLSALAAPKPRPAWGGVSLSSQTVPRWMLIFPVVLVLHGLTSYLGLRTAGNFSMFSNLRTEGTVSNHYLLGSNPVKLWTYQEDVVHLIRIDDQRARIGYAYRPLQGHSLPVVEFRKLIYAWTKAGWKIAMTFEYRGDIHSTEDIVNDPVWRTRARDWEMILMDFRVIQPKGPNRCRW